MKRTGRIASVLIVLALGLAVAPVNAAEGDGFSASWDFLPALWQMAVCIVGGRCAGSNEGPAIADRKEGPRSISAQHGMCVDPDGAPSPRACAETQILDHLALRDR